MNSEGQRDLRDHTDDDGANSTKLGRSRVNLHTNSLSLKGNATGMTDDDSGLPSSTKSGCRFSLSSDDTGEMEEKGGMLPCKDYRDMDSLDKTTMRKETSPDWEREGDKEREVSDSAMRVSQSVVVRPCYEQDYDEEVAVAADDQESIDSPRSDASSTREYDLTQLEAEEQSRGASTVVELGDQEMTTFSSSHSGFYDNDDGDSSSSDDNNIHRALYGRHSTPTVTPTTWSCDRPRASSTSSIRFTRSSNMLANEQTISSLRRVGASTTSVDDSVRFFPSSGSTQSRYSPDCISALSPPFGNDENLLKKVGSSISSLMSSSSSSYNMSQRAASGEGLSSDGKKKKKKKKDCKDESAQEGGTRGKPLMTTDVNGNPIDPQSYRQMRKPPRPNESSSAVSGSQGRSPASNHDYSVGRGDPQDMGNKSDDPTSPTGPGQSEKRKGKKKNSTPGKEIHPEKDPNYVGNIPDIDNLVKFINNDIGEKKLKKISKTPGDNASIATPAAAVATTTTTTDTAAASVGKTPKKPKGNGIKTTKQFQTTGVGESVEDCLAPASETTKLLSSTTSLTSSYSSICDRERIPSELVSESEDNLASGPDAHTVAKEMGNSTTSEKPNGEDDAMTKDNSDIVKNHRVREKSVESAVPGSPKPVGDAKTDANKNDKNHMLPSVTKSVAPVIKKEQSGEIKDSKAKPKSSGKDNLKGDHASSTDNNKKSRAKPPKIDMKASASTASEKSSPGETKAEPRVENSKDVDKAKDSQRAAASPDASSATQQTPSDFELPATFIFTDVDLPPKKEPEFTVVSAKKKKRSPTQPETVRQQSSNTSIQSFGQHHYSNKDAQPFQSHHTSATSSSFVPNNRAGQGQASSHYQRSGKRSFTPPPTLKVSRPESIAKTHATARDLSPSAFPVLTPGGSSDPRRRSMENLYDTGQLLQSDKDSDKESTKSLPADKNVGGRGGYALSYATILSAVTPRQSVDSSKAESVSSSMEDGANLEDYPTPTSSMKWKGSPQERRHSIGSAPEELSKAPTGSNLQRTGSQEVLPRDTDVVEKGGSVITVAGTMGMIQSDSAGSFVGSDADSARGSEAGSETPGEVFASPPPSVAATEDRKSSAVSEDKKTKLQAVSVSKNSTIPAVSVSRAPPPSQTVTSTGSGSGAGVSIPAQSSGVKPKATQPSSSSRSQGVATKADLISKTNQLVTKTVNNGHKNKKSVIFCNNSSPNVVPVDICFGGDPVFSNEELESSASLGNTSSGDKPAVFMPPAKDKVSGSIVSQPSAPSTTVAASATISSSSSNDINPSTKPPKGPHIAGLNGLVSPRPPDSRPVVLPQTLSTVPSTLSSNPAPTVQGQTVSLSVTPTVNFEGPAAKGPSVAPAARTEIPQSNNHPSEDHASGDMSLKLMKGGISFIIGARIKDKKPECKIFIQPEATAAASTSQARMDAVNFLRKGWNKVEKQLKNEAKSVHIYSSRV
ncbi:serine-rich adhesin for platelets-like [Littorina saxatilis]|uniref:serine-rich adhesin for platelets-like n=1 Tax=Littorina saxatilis TaxID=31220 RepID=UPI0038B5BAD8